MLRNKNTAIWQTKSKRLLIQRSVDLSTPAVLHTTQNYYRYREKKSCEESF